MDAVTRAHFTVRFCETDLMGIVHHSNYLQYFEVGRVEWLRARGVAYEKWMAQGVHLPVVDASLRYRLTARFDDRLIVETRVVDLARVSVRFGYRIVRDAPGEELVCEGDTRLACVGADLRPRRFPPDVAALLKGR